MSRPNYRVLTIEKPPFVIYDEVNNHWSGMLFDILHALSQRLNFTYEIRVQEDGIYGHMSDNGTWHGLVRSLMDNEADIGLAAMSYMAERLKVVDMTDPIYEAVGITALMLKPEPATEFFRFVTVLQRDVWLCIFGSFLVSSILIWFFDTWSPYSYQNNKEKFKDDPEKRIFTLKESLWFCLTSMTPQGGGETPKNLSGKLVAATWWLFGFIIVASYTANLAAYLTVAKYEKKIESFEDLIGQYKYHYSVVQNSATYRFFERMNDIELKFYEYWKDMSLNDSLSAYERSKLAVWEYPLSDKYIKIFSTLTQENLMVPSFREGVERVRNRSAWFALIGESTDVRYQALTDCSFKELGPEFSKKPMSFALRKDSNLTQQFNAVLRKLNDERWMEEFKNKWWKRNPAILTCIEDEEKNSGVIFDNIGGIFVLIGGGIILGIVTLVYEYFYYTYFRNDFEQFSENQREKMKLFLESKFKKLNLEDKINNISEEFKY